MSNDKTTVSDTVTFSIVRGDEKKPDTTPAPKEKK